MGNCPLDTEALDIVLNVQGSIIAKQQLQALKVFAADEFIQNFCEIYGVPNEILNVDDDTRIEWARNKWMEWNNK